MITRQNLQKISHLIHKTNTKPYTNASSYILQNQTAYVVTKHYRRELLMMDIMVPETC